MEMVEIFDVTGLYMEVSLLLAQIAIDPTGTMSTPCPRTYFFDTAALAGQHNNTLIPVVLTYYSRNPLRLAGVMPCHETHCKDFPSSRIKLVLYSRDRTYQPHDTVSFT